MNLRHLPITGRQDKHDGQLSACSLEYGFHHRLDLLSRGLKKKPWITRRHSSSGQEQPKRIGAAASACSCSGFRHPSEAELFLSRGRGAGVQPRGAARHRAPVFEARLVQDAAAQTDHPRGGLREPHHHQQVLLWTMQLLLHPQTHPPGGGRVPVLLLLQTQALHHNDVHVELSRPAAAHQEEAHPARQAVPLHIHRLGLDEHWRTGHVGFHLFVTAASDFHSSARERGLE